VYQATGNIEINICCVCTVDGIYHYTVKDGLSIRAIKKKHTCWTNCINKPHLFCQTVLVIWYFVFSVIRFLYWHACWGPKYRLKHVQTCVVFNEVSVVYLVMNTMGWLPQRLLYWVSVKLFLLIEQCNIEVSLLHCASVMSCCTFSKSYISFKLSEYYNLPLDKQHCCHHMEELSSWLFTLNAYLPWWSNYKNVYVRLISWY
jgi:hypothetical protein